MEFDGFIIEPQSGSAGTHDISVSIASVNEGIDKEVRIDGVCGDASARLTITHEGLRERFITADGMVFCVADGGRFAVLKQVAELPYAKEVECLKCTGTQWIDTGIVGSLETSYEIVASSDANIYDYMVLIGSRESAQSRVISTLWGGSGNNIVNDFGDYTKTRLSYAPIDGVTKYKIFNSSSKRSVYSCSDDSVKEATTKYSTEFTTPTNLYIGYKTSGFTTEMRNFSGKIYSCKIWQSDTLVRDFIPVLDFDGVACLFDKVSSSLFYSSNDKFIGDSIPDGCTKVDYLESDGTQYINTGLLSTSKSVIDIEYGFSSIESGSSNNLAVFGGRNTQTSGTFTLFKIASATPQYMRFDWTGQRTIATSNELTWDVNSIYRFVFDGGNAIITNTSTNETSPLYVGVATTFSQTPIHLFCVNTNGTKSTFMKGRIYRCTYSNGERTVDLIPILDKEGVACMYDKVSGELFYNQGTGSFKAGYKS